MDFSVTDEQKAWREEVVRFARKELNEGVSERDRSHAFPREQWLRCGELGLHGLPASHEYGGAGADPLSTALSLEALGYGCEDSGLVMSIGSHISSCVLPVMKFGTDRQKDRYLKGLCDGSVIGAHAMSEPSSGSDAFGMLTRAEADGDHYVINGTKTFISNGPVAEVYFLYAVTDPEKRYHGGITVFLVERDTPGLTVGATFDKMGLRTWPLCELAFEDVRVHKDAVLGTQVGAGAPIFTVAIDWERVLLYAGKVGTMERLLETAVSYARNRKQFGEPIGKFQAVSHRIADMKVALEASRLLIYKAAWRLGKRPRSASLDASIAKLFCSESLVDAAMATVQIHGGYGYMTEYQVERALRDSIAGRIYCGTSETQRNIISRWLGVG